MGRISAFGRALLLAAVALGGVTGALAQIKPATAPAVTVIQGPIQVDPSGVPPQLGAPTTSPPAGTWQSVELAAQSSGECPKTDMVKGIQYGTGNLQIQKDGTLPCVDVGTTEMYYRGVGKVPGCGGTREKGFLGRCYEPCNQGFDMISGRCYVPCPAGFTDVPPSNAPADAKRGLVCRKPAAYGRGAGYPWKLGDTIGSLDEARARCRKDNPQGCEKNGEIIYPKCREGYKAFGSNICSPKCPTGMTDTGIDCTKASYTPPSSMASTCPAGEDLVDGLCYKGCRAPYKYWKGDPGYVCKRVVQPLKP